MVGATSAFGRLSDAAEASVRRHLTVTERLVLLLGVCIAVLAALFLLRGYVIAMGPVPAFAGFAIAALCLLIANGVAARSIVLPLKQTCGYCEAIGRFQYDNPIDLGWPDEIGDFMRAIDRMQGRLRDNEAELRMLSGAVEHSPVSVVITDREGTIRYVNPKFCAVTGYAAGEAIGQNPRILNSGRQPAALYADLWATIGAGREWHGEFANRKKNGEVFWEHASISPIFDSRGDITRFVAVKEDITQEKQAKEALRQSEERFDLAMRATTHGLWDWNLETNEVYYSPRWKEILGYADGELEDRLEIFDRLFIRTTAIGRAPPFGRTSRVRPTGTRSKSGCATSAGTTSMSRCAASPPGLPMGAPIGLWARTSTSPNGSAPSTRGCAPSRNTARSWSGRFKASTRRRLTAVF